MVITEETVSKWKDEGRKEGNKGMLLMCDTFDWDLYPKYFKSLEEMERFSPSSMQQKYEIHDLTEEERK